MFVAIFVQGAQKNNPLQNGPARDFFVPRSTVRIFGRFYFWAHLLERVTSHIANCICIFSSAIYMLTESCCSMQKFQVFLCIFEFSNLLEEFFATEENAAVFFMDSY